MMEFYTNKILKARKTHICEMCGENIHAGERYSYESGKNERCFFERMDGDKKCVKYLDQ